MAFFYEVDTWAITVKSCLAIQKAGRNGSAATGFSVRYETSQRELKIIKKINEDLVYYKAGQTSIAANYLKRILPQFVHQ